MMLDAGDVTGLRCPHAVAHDPMGPDRHPEGAAGERRVRGCFVVLLDATLS